MTIDGFWKEVNERIPLEQFRIPFPDYVYSHFNRKGKFLTIGVDIYQWIFEHTNFAESQSFTGLPESEKSVSVIVAGIASKLRYLISLPLNFVIVFDGTVKLDKHRWEMVKDSTSIIFEERYFEDLGKIRNEEHIMSDNCVTALLELLKAWNISYLHAPGDAEIELARLNRAGIIDAIISNDADAFAYGAKVILRNFSKFPNDKPSTATKGGIKKNSEYFVTPVNRDTIDQLNLDTDKIMFIACCQGDDYSRGMKGLGIKKSWALATNTNADFDVVQGLKSIYISQNKDEYLNGRLPFSYQQRLVLLEKYKNRLLKHIADNGRAYFGRVHSSDVLLPDDHVIASHFYPHFSKYLFRFESYENNLNEYSGRTNFKCHLPLLPQPLSIIECQDNKHKIHRGNSLKGSLGFTEFCDFVSVSSEPVSYTPIHWFEEIDYEILLKWTKTGRSQKQGNEFLAESLGKCYVWRAILNTEELNIKTEDIFIKSQKSVQVKKGSSEFEQAFYQIKYKPLQIFRTILNFDTTPPDDDLDKTEEEYVHVWLTSFLLFIDENGRKLIERYNDEKSSKANTPKSTPKRTPRKNRTPTQKTTLDLLSSSSKSPIKILTRKPSLLEMSGASKSIAVKRTVLDVDTSDVFSSPKKKVKQNLVEDGKPKTSSVLLDPFEEDVEVSRVLESSAYVGDSSFAEGNKETGTDELFFDTHENFTSFFNESRQTDLVHPKQNDQTFSTGQYVTNRLFDNKNESTLSTVIPIRKNFEKDKLTISRGISDFDKMTKLPQVPFGPLKTVNNQELEDDLEKKCSKSLNDTFSSTDSMEKLFAIENRSKETDAKNLETKQRCFEGNSSSSLQVDAQAKEISEITNLDDTFSSMESVERIFGVQRAVLVEPHTANVNFPDKSTNTEANFSTNLNLDDKNIFDIENTSDVDTLEEVASTPIKKTILSRTKNVSSTELVVEPVKQEESFSLPSNFDGDEILLAESTDDESMWVIPEKDKSTIFDEDILEL